MVFARKTWSEIVRSDAEVVDCENSGDAAHDGASRGDAYFAAYEALWKDLIPS